MFEKEPSIVIITASSGYAGGGFLIKTLGTLVAGYITSGISLFTNIQNNKVSWYADNRYESSWSQLNESGTKYYYSAITI